MSLYNFKDIFPVDVTVDYKHKKHHGTGSICFNRQCAQDLLTKISSRFISSSFEDVNDIHKNVKNSVDIATTASQQMVYVLLIGTWLMILFLILIMFGALNYPQYWYYFLIFIIIVMIIFGVIIYFWALSIKNDSINKLVKNKNNIKKILPTLKDNLINSCCDSCVSSIDQTQT